MTDNDSLAAMGRDELLTTVQVCKLLDIAKSTFYNRYKNRSDFPRPYKYSDNMQARTRYSLREILAWKENRRLPV